MSQRDSGYERKERDLYETPAWVTAALMTHLPSRMRVWEPACGSGKMVIPLMDAGHTVAATDIAGNPSHDFLQEQPSETMAYQAIITNPPYVHAKEFIWKALELTEPWRGIVAMLLRTDFDHASSRRGLFRYSPQFAAKVVLTKRIKWFEDSKGQPSFNHAWFIWDWKHQGAPTLAYGP